GKLMYIKTTLTVDEPSDVVEYRSAHTEFPHETTVDQFFTESQFESYRKLGYHIIRNMFGEGDFRDSSSDDGGISAKQQPPNGDGSKQQEQRPTDTQPPTPALESTDREPIKKIARDGLDELLGQLEQRWYPSSTAN